MSLVFGGYDASRLGRDNLQVTFTPDAGRELTVGLQSVTKVSASGNTTLLSSAILARLDSSQPYIWLPLSSCQSFEQAFGLVWDSPTETYPVNDALHTKLLSENASVVFTLSDGVQGSKSIDVSMPYGSFDLQYRVPTQTNSSRYFPLRRAANNTQVRMLQREDQCHTLTIQTVCARSCLSPRGLPDCRLREKYIQHISDLLERYKGARYPSHRFPW